ncbi:MAG: hypothetical protein SGJ27_11265 [Candidatus Melainabacteria bacterium]|nr:hypothetical protein [Candidatus Melainabacteria bacterium]
MTTGSNPADSTTATVTKTTGGGILQRILTTSLLFVAMGFGGYFLGTQAQFSLQAEPKTFANLPGMSLLNPPVKRLYWLHSKGADRAGYMIRVLVNGQLVATFVKPDINVDITKHMKPGTNIIAYSATTLAADQKSDLRTAALTVELKSAEKKDEAPNKFEGGSGLDEYTRHVTDSGNFNEIHELLKVE